ncbi:MAG: AI-2E family transporter [Ottowia sp.]|nr:AI-2E family transporter [Ottowia sp.]
MNSTTTLRRAVFLLLLAAVTVAFLWVLAPFFGAILWAVTLALLFYPFNQWMHRRLGGRSNLASLLTLLFCVLIVIVPIALIGTSLATDILTFIQKARAGGFDLHDPYQQVLSLLPDWITERIAQLHWLNLEQVIEKLSEAALQGGQIVARHTLEVGQNTFQFVVNFGVMLYLLFFLLRDGTRLAGIFRQALPLEPEHTDYLLEKFSTVVRATVKGNIVIAIVQGTLGGLAFWVLGVTGALFWGVVMALLSLMPAIGAALVWAPVALYLLATGAIWQGVVLIVWGVVAIGLSDNVLRPMLVGKDTKLPDWIVLLSTLGGMVLFGINGFVIGPTIAALFIACWSLFGHTQQNGVDAASAPAPADDDGNPDQAA